MKKKVDMISARTELAPSSPKSGIVFFFTILPKIYIITFRGVQTVMHSSTVEKREAVMTDDGASDKPTS